MRSLFSLVLATSACVVLAFQPTPFRFSPSLTRVSAWPTPRAPPASPKEEWLELIDKSSGKTKETTWLRPQETPLETLSEKTESEISKKEKSTPKVVALKAPTSAPAPVVNDQAAQQKSAAQQATGEAVSAVASKAGNGTAASGAALLAGLAGASLLGPAGFLAGAVGGFLAASSDGLAGELVRDFGRVTVSGGVKAFEKVQGASGELAAAALERAEKAAKEAEVQKAAAAKLAEELRLAEEKAAVEAEAKARAEAEAKAKAEQEEAEAKAKAEIEGTVVEAARAAAGAFADALEQVNQTPNKAADTLLRGLAVAQLGYLPAQTFKQEFLEASPYYDQSSIPINTFKAKAPFMGKVVSTKRIVGPKATGETCDVVIDHGGDMPYWEGQSFGVIPPGTNPKNGKPNGVRLYSIAASRYGDDLTGKQTTLCVRRATYWDEAMGKDDPAKKGVCSNYLCDATPGTEVKMTGPSGKVMLMPEATPEADIIMVATGTGIAPFRAFWKRLFIEDTPAAANYKGLCWLFLGVANTDALLYDDELQSIAAAHPDNFRLDYALSREQSNVKGGKMYIQDKVEEYSDEVFDRLDNGAHMYFCGLKGMMPGVLTMLEGVCKKKGINYSDWIAGLKKKGQWHVEVY